MNLDLGAYERNPDGENYPGVTYYNVPHNYIIIMACKTLTFEVFIQRGVCVCI